MFRIVMGRSHARSHRRTRSRSKSRSKNRSPLHDRDRRRHHEHKHSSRSAHKSSDEKTKDTQKGIDAVKSRMRSALDTAAHSQLSSSQPIDDDESAHKDTTKTTDDCEVSASEAASRHRDIKRIDEGAFHSTSFKSTAGGAGGRVKKEDKNDREVVVAKKQDAHDKAMFGPKWRDPVIKNEQQNHDDETTPVIPVQKEIQVANDRLSADPAEREARWLKIFRERRARLLCL